MDRISRQIANSKQDKIELVKSQPSAATLREGQEVMYITRDNRLARYRKEQGRLWVSYMSNDGNQIVDKTLTAEELKITKRFTTYKIIAHNMTDEIDTSEVFLPWFGITEAADLTGVSSSFLAPYSMTLKKIMFRPSAISTNPGSDLVVRLKKMDDKDTTVDTVASATYGPALSADTYLVVEKSDFNGDPKFEIGDNCGISIQAADDYGGEIQWKITSVWAVEITI